jgi:ferric-chelate reductase
MWRGLDKTQASVELLATDTVRLTLRREMLWRPGQHVFLNLPGISAFPAELHPFTIASISDNGDRGVKKVVCIIRVCESSLLSMNNAT